MTKNEVLLLLRPLDLEISSSFDSKPKYSISDQVILQKLQEREQDSV